MERHRIGNDLHDDLGATLNSVHLMTEIAHKEASQRAKDLLPLFENMKAAVADSIHRVREIVWSLNPEILTLENFTDYIRDFTQKFFHYHDVKLVFEMDNISKNTVLPDRAKLNLYLTYKEALNNIMKYAAATVIYVEIKGNEEDMEMTLRDNGCGFDSTSTQAGNGMRTMRERVETLGGQFVIHSSIDSGTEINIKIPL